MHLLFGTVETKLRCLRASFQGGKSVSSVPVWPLNAWQGCTGRGRPFNTKGSRGSCTILWLVAFPGDHLEKGTAVNKQCAASSGSTKNRPRREDRYRTVGSKVVRTFKFNGYCHCYLWLRRWFTDPPRSGLRLYKVGVPGKRPAKFQLCTGTRFVGFPRKFGSENVLNQMRFKARQIKLRYEENQASLLFTGF